MERSKFILNSVLVIGALLSTELLALPGVDKVANGSVDITQAAEAGIDKLQINQASDKAIVNWNDFNVKANESVHFQQPTNGVCLNRVNAENGLSQIDGSVSATGRIFLINQAGVVFSETARVNVGGIVVSTSDLSDDNFLKQQDRYDTQYVFDQASTKQGSVINRGVINVADQGMAAFLGTSVSNEGVIVAKASDIYLANGKHFTLDFWGNHLIEVEVSAPAETRGVDDAGKELANGVNVSGVIINDAGEVYISSGAVQGVFDNLINMGGIIQANSIVEKNNGVIILNAQGPGSIKVTGELIATGAEANSAGGNVAIFAENITLDEVAKIDVSAGLGGGIVAVGWPEGLADELADVGLQPAKHVTVGPEVTINADAKDAGKGGVILVASNDTNFTGKVSSQGAGGTADGGQVFIYGVAELSDASKPNVSAVNGKQGESYFTDKSKIIEMINQWILNND